MERITVPEMGESVTHVTVERWFKQPGDHVTRGEPILEAVTDKVNVEIVSQFTGTLMEIRAGPGTIVPIGGELATFDEDSGRVVVSHQPAPLVTESEAIVSNPSEVPTVLRDADSGGVPSSSGSDDRSSPAAPRASLALRRLARISNVDLTTVVPTGADGQVTRDDVLGVRLNHPQRASNAPLHRDVGVQPPRDRIAASRETEGSSLSTIAMPYAMAGDDPENVAGSPPPLTMVQAGSFEHRSVVDVERGQMAERVARRLVVGPQAWTYQDVDMTALITYQQSEEERFSDRHGVHLTCVPFVAQIVTDALRAFPYLNSTWAGNDILLHDYCDLGIEAIHAERAEVLVVPGAERLGFVELVKAINVAFQDVRPRHRPSNNDRAATFSLSNIGAAGSVASVPIIVPPQVALLSMEAIVKRPVVIGDGIGIRPMMNLCLSFDHRLIDGLMASRFLGHIKRRMESWTPVDIRI